MLSKFRAAGLVSPTLFALAALAMLLALGTWQMSRKAWKDGLQRQIDARAKAAVMPLGGHVGLIKDPEYLRVKVKGRFLIGQERHLYWLSGGQAGWLVVTPMVTADEMVVLVNRGWVPDALKDSARRREDRIAGVVEVTGLLRMPEQPSRFTPANGPEKNIWYWRDVPEMMKCRHSIRETPDCQALAGPPGLAGLPFTYPFSVDAEAEPANPGGWPRGGTTNLKLPNKHLEYAVTWYGLALTLIGVFAAFALGRLRGLRA